MRASERAAGQYIDTSLFEGALALSIWESAECGRPGGAGQLGSAHRLTAPYQALRTADGYITVGGNTQELFERLCAPSAGRSSRTTRASRPTTTDGTTSPTWSSELEAALAHAHRRVGRRAVEGGVPCGPIHDYAQVFADAHTQAREMEVESSTRSRARSARSASR